MELVLEVQLVMITLTIRVDQKEIPTFSVGYFQDTFATEVWTTNLIHNEAEKDGNIEVKILKVEYTVVTVPTYIDSNPPNARNFVCKLAHGLTPEDAGALKPVNEETHLGTPTIFGSGCRA